MNNLTDIILKEEIKLLILEIDTEKELEKEIEQYFKVQKEVDAKEKEIADKIAEIKKINSSLTSRFKKIQKYMEDHDVQEKKVNNWVARLKTVAAYARIQPDYKTLWLEALKKVNEATRRVMQNLESVQVETKRAATKIELELQQEGIMDTLKGLWTKFKGLITSLGNYKKVVDKLPDLNSIKEVSTSAGIGYDSKYFLKKTKKKKNEAKADYPVYHNSYSSAVDTIVNYPEKFGYTIGEDEVWNKISTGPKKPSDGKTNRFSLELYKNGKLQRKSLNAQVYGMGNKYELNMYIN